MKYVFVGDTVDFTNESSNTYYVDSWDWKIDGTSFATTENSSNVFNSEGTFNIALEATGSWGTNTVSKTEQIAVLPAIPAPTIVETTIPDMIAGIPYNTRLHVTAGTGYGKITWSAIDLPSNMSIDPDTGIISGMPYGDLGSTPMIVVTDAVGRTGTTTFNTHTYTNTLFCHFDAAEGITKDTNNNVSEWLARNDSGITLSNTDVNSQPVFTDNSINTLPSLNFTQGKNLILAPLPDTMLASLIVYRASGTNAENIALFSIAYGADQILKTASHSACIFPDLVKLGSINESHSAGYSKSNNIDWTIMSAIVRTDTDNNIRENGYARALNNAVYWHPGTSYTANTGGINRSSNATYSINAGASLDIAEIFIWRAQTGLTGEVLATLIKHLCKKYNLPYLGA